VNIATCETTYVVFMSSEAAENAEPVTETVHENSWSANLETPAHADDRELVQAHATEAIAHTAAGYHVNLVTHEAHGHPEEYLFAHLDSDIALAIDYEYVSQCGCGGHVTRVYIGD
jgi:putative CGCGG family rSAM target protein